MVHLKKSDRKTQRNLDLQRNQDTQRNKDQRILDIVLKDNLPDEEWVVLLIQSLPDAMEHYNNCSNLYMQKYSSSNNSQKRNKKILTVKLRALKEEMISQFVHDYCTRQLLTIKKKNTIISNYFYKLNIKKQLDSNQELVSLGLVSKIKNTLKNALNIYFSFGDFEKDYYNKIGVLKYNSLVARNYYLTTGKAPYEIIS